MSRALRIPLTYHLGVLFGLLGGATLFGQSPANDAEVVALPPFYVEPDRPFRWTALSAPGFEIITTHDRQFAVAFARSYYRQLELIRLIIPDRYLWRPAVADRFIVVEPHHKRLKSDHIVGQILDQKDPTGRRKNGRVFLPNFGLSSPDSSTVFAFHDLNASFGIRPTLGRGFHPFNNSTPPDLGFHSNTKRITERLLRRAPALPSWAIQGLARFYDECQFIDNLIDVEGLPPLPPPPPPLPAEPDSATPGTAAKPEADSPDVAASAPSPPPLPPAIDFAFLFTHPSPSDPAILADWLDQAKLFVRWALFADDGQYKSAFWQFVDRQEHALPDDLTFSTCFGFDFAAATTQITAFRADAATKKLRLEIDDFEPPVGLQASRAAPDQVARILGEWEQLETDYVRKIEPDLTETYLQRARQTIASARQAGNDSRELTAVAGLLEFEAGNLPAARRELEIARALGVTRPYALQSLARLQFNESLAALPDDKLLDLEQVGPILSLLRQAHEQVPALPGVYQLFAEVWLQTDLPLLRDDVIILAAGTRRFPQHADVVLRMALLQTQRGQPQSAFQIIDYGSQRTIQPAVYHTYRRFYEELRHSIDTTTTEASSTPPE